MDKKKGLLNISVSIIFNVLSMIMVIVVKRFLIKACGNDVNGLNALYQSIIGVLSVAELGIGSAISFCMYKPIVEGNNKKVSALYHLFRKLHLGIGGVIFVIGLLIIPFIKYLAKDYATLDINVYFTFLLVLISSVITYFFGAKIGLINAYKNNYITSAITYGGLIFQYILQIIILIITKSFIIYLMCRIVGVLLQWLIINIITRRKYYQIISNVQKVDSETKQELIKSIKAMFMHKIGRTLVNTVDNIVISAFVGVIALGEYSNYIVILTAVTGVIKLIFSSLTSVIGHLYAESGKETSKANCENLHYINFFVGLIFFLGYYAIIDNLVAMFFGVDLIVERTIAFVITFNGFVQFMRESVIVYRDATGTFYYDRWKSVIEGIVNIVLSIIFVTLFGVVGVIVATILTNLMISHIIEPLVLYKNAFNVSPKKHYFRNYTMITIFFITLFVMHFCMVEVDNQMLELLINGFISVGFSSSICLVTVLTNKSMRKYVLNKILKNKNK